MVSVKNRNVRVDFDKDTESDFMRFYVYKDDKPVRYGSNVTMVRFDADDETIRRTAECILEILYSYVARGASIEKIVDSLQYIS